MASPQVDSVPTRLSFAKVLSMPPPAWAKLPPNASNKPQQTSRSSENVFDRMTSQKNQLAPSVTPAPTNVAVARTEGLSAVDVVTGAIEGLSLVRDAERAQGASNGRQGTDSTEDDRSHLSNSSSKLQNFDTKSLASVTTFAMDEKESIRPDDSASVRAADEEESVNGSGANSTTQGTAEQAVAARNNHRAGANAVSIAARRYPTITMTNPPRFGDLPVEPPVMEIDEPRSSRLAPPLSTDNDSNIQHFPTLIVTPDDKLLEALATPKDRLPLLQLEEKVLGFVSQARDDILDLPPQNSFTRLLTHKVADYYGLQHHATEDGDSVRIYKTAYHILPTPLSVYAQNIPIGPLPPPGSAAFKIMRRTGLENRQQSATASTAASSSAPSKPTSESGGEHSDEGLMSPFDGTPSRDRSKLTREEREANYKAARERIFGDFQETTTCENGSTGENSASMSRSSSASGKRKQRRQRTPKDDSFEARSSFVPGYAGMSVPGLPAQYHPPSVEQSYCQTYSNDTMPFGQGTHYGTTPTQAYPGLASHTSYQGAATFSPHAQQQYSSNDSWPNTQAPQPGGFYNFSNSSQGQQAYPQHMAALQAPTNLYAAAHQPGMQQSSQNWAGSQYQASYEQAPTVSQSPQPPPWSSFGHATGVQTTAPYQYGQLPAQHYPSQTSYSNQHPVPGSYSGRSLFNPQTRSFVPSNSSSRSGGRSSRKKGACSPGLSRNGSAGTSLPMDSTTTNGLSLRATAYSGNLSSPRPKEDSLQQRYGAPAHLPKKPPPSQVSSQHNGQAIGMVGNPPLVVNGSGFGPVV